MKKTYIRISPDIDVLCINSDSCCASAYGDEIYNDSPWRALVSVSSYQE